jgi:hypothetical protein
LKHKFVLRKQPFMQLCTRKKLFQVHPEVLVKPVAAPLWGNRLFSLQAMTTVSKPQTLIFKVMNLKSKVMETSSLAQVVVPMSTAKRRSTSLIAVSILRVSLVTVQAPIVSFGCFVGSETSRRSEENEHESWQMSTPTPGGNWSPALLHDFPLID